MRVFQFVRQVPYYISHFEAKYGTVLDSMSYKDMRELYINDRFYSTHVLHPILNFEWDKADFTVWDYEKLQKKWAEENHFKYTNLIDILYAQIEAFRPEVIYNLHPVAFSNKEINKIPGTPLKICWFAAPINGRLDFSPYHARLTNFPLDLKGSIDFKNLYFYPAVDDLMDKMSTNEDRDIDILFYGQYLYNHFENRNRLIDQLIDYKRKSGMNIKIHLRCHVQDAPLYDFPYIRRFRKIKFPKRSVLENNDGPLFGVDLYRHISRSKIVFNAAVDFSGDFKVNMRNYESVGCGALLISENGNYPRGFKNGENFIVYDDFDDFISKAVYYLRQEEERKNIAIRGRNEISQIYSKKKQWADFLNICENLT